LTVNEDFRELERRPMNNSRDSLVERLDPALGEASSGIGVLLSELVRRTLRGGVAKIEEEMHDFAQEKVDLAVESRMPQFQEAATQTAERKAEVIARQEVQGVEQQVRETSSRLTQQLSDAQRLAEEAAERLSQELVATERRVEDKARSITQVAVGTVEQETKATAEKLTIDIAETERRAEVRARELVAEHVEELKQRSKQTYLQVREALDELTRHSASLDEQVAREQQERQAEVASLRETINMAVEAQTQDLRTLLQQLVARNEHLEARLAELEKPRGLRAWFRRLLAGRKRSEGQVATPAAAPESVES
jgi:chromosome segregation ATPase